MCWFIVAHVLGLNAIFSLVKYSNAGLFMIFFFCSTLKGTDLKLENKTKTKQTNNKRKNTGSCTVVQKKAGFLSPSYYYKRKGAAYLDVTHHNSVLISAGGRGKRLSCAGQKICQLFFHCIIFQWGRSKTVLFDILLFLSLSNLQHYQIKGKYLPKCMGWKARCWTLKYLLRMYMICIF